MLRRHVSAAIAAVLFAAPAPRARAPRARGQRPASRVMAAGRWRTVGTVGGAANDVLLNPGLLSAWRDRIVVFDYGDMKVKAYSASGASLWKVGRRGGGPGEFANPTGMTIDALGRTWILDPPNSRTTALDSAGAVLATVPIRGYAMRVFEFARSKLVLLGPTPTAFLTEVDSAGRVMRTLAYPRTFQAAGPLGLQSAVAQLPSASGVIAFSYADWFAVMDSAAAMPRLYHGVEPVAFPKMLSFTPKAHPGYQVTRLDPSAVHGAISVAVDSTRVWILFGGASGRAGHVLDTYRLSDGAYVASYPLPADATAIAMSSVGLVYLTLDPVPAITIAQWVRSR